jgi:hypothetical protein
MREEKRMKVKIRVNCARNCVKKKFLLGVFVLPIFVHSIHKENLERYMYIKIGNSLHGKRDVYQKDEENVSFLSFWLKSEFLSSFSVESQ